MRVELLVTATCPLADPFRENLREALSVLNLPMYVETVLNDLDESDPRAKYDSPTVLVEDVDLFEMPPRTLVRPQICRRYAEGVPSKETLVASLKKRTEELWEKIDDLR